MRRKALQDVANVLCPMLLGRIGEDLEALSELPDGLLVFDILGGSVAHDQNGPLSLRVAGELRAWLENRMGALKIPPNALKSVLLRAEFRTDRIPTNKQRIVLFDWECEVLVATDEKVYSARLTTSKWHERNGWRSLGSPFP